MPIKYYKVIVNNKEEVVWGSWQDRPVGHQEISRDEAVAILQKNKQTDRLAQLPVQGADSGYVIGPNGNLMTKEAAANYIPSPQESAQGIRGTGQYAGMTYAEVNAKTLPKAPTGQLLGADFSISPPTTQLKRGDTGAEVKKLQDYLVSQGYMTQAQVNTGYGTYGPQTEAAVLKMQNALGVDNATGPGVYGPRTIKAVQGTVGGGGGTMGGGGGATSNVDLDVILANPSLSADQKAAIQAIYNAVESNNADTAMRIQAAMKAASEFSDPYFKAQIRLATDSLQRGMTGKEGDLAFAEAQKKAALEELRASTVASKDLLSFEHQQELKNLATKYETDLETTRQNLAATGFTSSSKRARAEQILNEQNQGLVESSNKKYGYETGRLERGLTAGETSTAAEIENLRRLNEEGKLDILRQTEEKVGSSALSSLGYGNLLGDIGGSIQRQKALDQFQFASNFVF